ncbi:MAG: hypothetical protein WC829_15105 [Hyphomicrobium sp.]|jgi:hypothetical protein
MRRVPISPKAAEEIRKQLDRFEKRFGRKPLPGEPVFFDPETSGDVPLPLDPEKLMDQAIAALRAAGADEAVLYAAKKTDRLLTRESYAAAPRHIQQEWDSAIAEYREKVGKR